MKNELVKIYVGRRSMCAADDVNAPNMKCLFVSDDLDEFAAKLCEILPFGEWSCYLGSYGKGIQDVKDGIIVWDKKDERALVSRKFDPHKKAYFIVKCDENWFELVKAHPYLFCK